MPYAEYQSLLRLPAAAARKALVTGAGGETDRALDRLLASVDDDALRALLADLGGHDLALILDALDEAARHRDGPSVIVAHTIKGWGLPLAGDPMNHTALLTTAQIEALRASLGIGPGDEWARFDEGSAEAELIRRLPPLYERPVAPPRDRRHSRASSTRPTPARRPPRRRSAACSARWPASPPAMPS